MFSGLNNAKEDIKMMRGLGQIHGIGIFPKKRMSMGYEIEKHQKEQAQRDEQQRIKDGTQVEYLENEIRELKEKMRSKRRQIRKLNI